MHKENNNVKILKSKIKKYSEEIQEIKTYILPDGSSKLELSSACSYINNLEISAIDRMFLNMTLTRYLEIKKLPKLANQILKLVEKENKDINDPFISWEVSEFYKQRILLKNKRK